MKGLVAIWWSRKSRGGMECARQDNVRKTATGNEHNTQRLL